MRICYFGKYDPNYSRNSIIRTGLAQNGVEVVECQVAGGLGLTLYRGLMSQMRLVKGHLDAILVAEHNQFVVPLAWAWARKRHTPLIFDPFTSAYDTDVFDRGVVQAGSLKARRRFWLDRVSMRLADVVLTDTDQQRRYFTATFGLQASKLHVVPVGADDTRYTPRLHQHDASRFLVLFWGTYIPLHGIETILQAAHHLKEDRAIAVELIGDGQTYSAMQQLAGKLDLPKTMFRPRIPFGDLPKLIAQADVCLGIFGNTPKARRVVPNKVYEALAMRKPIITGDSPALREFLTPGKHVEAIPMSDSQALAEGIVVLKGDTALRESLAANGYSHYQEHFTPRAIGYMVKQILEQIR